MALCDCSELSCYPVLLCDSSGYWLATKYEIATMVRWMNGCNEIFSKFQYDFYSQDYPNFQQQQPYMEAHLLANEICHVTAVEYVKAVGLFKI